MAENSRHPNERSERCLRALTVSALKEHRARQNAERLLVGAGWNDLDLVFCREDGTPLHPERLTRSFSERVRQLGLLKIRPHAPRC